MVANRWSSFTARELEIIRELAIGHTSREISAVLNISESWIKQLVVAMFDKIGCDTRLELANWYAFDHKDEVSEWMEIARQRNLLRKPRKCRLATFNKRTDCRRMSKNVAELKRA